MARSPAPTDDVGVRSRRGADVVLGPILDHEQGALFALFDEIVARGDGFPHAPPLTRVQFDDYWVRPVTMTVVARLDDGAPGSVAGAYYLKPNSPGRAAHIANAGFLVAPDHRRRGIGRLLVEDSLWRAPLLGFDAMQFNLVFASNPARRLYEDLGFEVVGTIPDAVEGEDALVYWRRLEVPAG
jgi:GNAT superfamily N-acetyltransferase